MPLPSALPPVTVTKAAPPDSGAAGSLLVREQEVWHVDPDQRPKRAPCPETKDNEIVVCAPKEDDPARNRLGAPPPTAPSVMDEIARKLTVKVGPAEIGPGGPQGAVGIHLRIRF